MTFCFAKNEVKMNKVTTQDLEEIEKVAKKHKNFFHEIEENISKKSSEARDFIVEEIRCNVYDINDSLNSDLKDLLTELENYFGNDADSYIDRLQEQMKYARNFIINAYADFVFKYGGISEDYFMNDINEYYQKEEFDVNEINSILEDAKFEKLPLKS